jgi:EAL domain-containing protein (putative c-di-GMP-specific phosphodiesterase class I)
MNDNLADRGRIAPLGDVLAHASTRFVSEGALGLVCVDAAPLAEVETRYGQEVHERTLRELADIVRAASATAVGSEALLAAGEVGRSEVLLFLPRPAADAEFYTRGLPGVVRELRQRLDRNGHRVVYPYLRKLPPIDIGFSFVIRNPLLGPTTQIRRALGDAREDAQLNGRLAQRRRRWEFVDLLLSGRVRSVFEPIVDAKSLTVFGYEALVRGPEESSFGSPLELFSMAEQEDLLFELDCLCRRKALEGAVDFPEGAKLFINIRPTAIHDPSFQPDALTRTLDACGLAPTDCVFEISEQESIENYAIFREARDAYGKLGFQFALDDTGAGYASLEAVMELEPEFIKVDRAFVQGIDEDPARQNMLRAFLAIARDMNARIIGEGLDKLEELRMLGELGIHFGQGWLFGKPSPLRAQRS